MPARPFIGVSKDDLAEAKEIMLEHLTKRLGK
jgi:phage gpG-like protein